ncbi:MAG: TauD/TfdA family dioxygenase [Deltaproteobacteria bacterium]
MEFVRAEAVLGAEVRGVDLRQALSSDAVGALQTGLVEHGVLFFRRQEISAADHARLAGYFGPARPHPAYPTVAGYPEITILESDREHPSKIEKWHTDMTFLAQPPLGSVLRARVLPPTGGDTLFMSLGAAFDALSESMQHKLDGLSAEHSFAHGFRESLAEPGGLERLADALAANPPVVHPVVRRHPGSGRRVLFVNSLFTVRLLDMEDAESTELLDFLYQHLARAEFQVRFVWAAHSLVIWDNRQTQHCPVNDYWPATRRLERITIEGDTPR